MACIILWSSAVTVLDSQAYRKMDVTRKRILELREILLSIQTGFSLVNAAVVCAILESTSGLEPSTVITEPRSLKLVTVSSFCPFTLFSAAVPEQPNDQPHQSPKQSHAEDHIEQIEATSGEDHR